MSKPKPPPIPIMVEALRSNGYTVQSDPVANPDACMAELTQIMKQSSVRSLQGTNGVQQGLEEEAGTETSQSLIRDKNTATLADALAVRPCALDNSYQEPSVHPKNTSSGGDRPMNIDAQQDSGAHELEVREAYQDLSFLEIKLKIDPMTSPLQALVEMAGILYTVQLDAWSLEETLSRSSQVHDSVQRALDELSVAGLPLIADYREGLADVVIELSGLLVEQLGAAVAPTPLEIQRTKKALAGLECYDINVAMNPSDLCGVLVQVCEACIAAIFDRDQQVSGAEQQAFEALKLAAHYDELCNKREAATIIQKPLLMALGMVVFNNKNKLKTLFAKRDMLHQLTELCCFVVEERKGAMSKSQFENALKASTIQIDGFYLKNGFLEVGMAMLDETFVLLIPGQIKQICGVLVAHKNPTSKEVHVLRPDTVTAMEVQTAALQVSDMSVLNTVIVNEHALCLKKKLQNDLRRSDEDFLAEKADQKPIFDDPFYKAEQAEVEDYVSYVQHANLAVPSTPVASTPGSTTNASSTGPTSGRPRKRHRSRIDPNDTGCHDKGCHLQLLSP